MKAGLFFKRLKRKIRGGAFSEEELRSYGVTLGKNCHIYGSIDQGHGFLVFMGDNVTMANGSVLLTHDGSTKKMLGYSRVGRVDIGSDVFIGAQSVVLPNVRIGSRVIIGAGSIVTKDIPDNSVAVGNPARVISTYDDYMKKAQHQLETLPKWDTHYSQKSEAEKRQMAEMLQKSGYGFDI